VVWDGVKQCYEGKDGQNKRHVMIEWPPSGLKHTFKTTDHGNDGVNYEDGVIWALV